MDDTKKSAMSRGWTGNDFHPIPAGNISNHFGMLPLRTPSGGVDFGANYYLARGQRSSVYYTPGAFADVPPTPPGGCPVPKSCDAPPMQFCRDFECPAGSVATVTPAGEQICVGPKAAQ